MNNSTLAQICTFANEGKNPRQQTGLQHDILIMIGNEIWNSDGPITEVCKIEMLKICTLPSLLALLSSLRFPSVAVQEAEWRPGRIPPRGSYIYFMDITKQQYLIIILSTVVHRIMDSRASLTLLYMIESHHSHRSADGGYTVYIRVHVRATVRYSDSHPLVPMTKLTSCHN